jgi:hypothetical protein
VIVVKQLEQRVHIPSLGLKFLRHGREDDFALVYRSEVERAFAGAKHFGDFGRQEVLQIVADGFAHAAELLVGLCEKAVCEVSTTAWRTVAESNEVIGGSDADVNREIDWRQDGHGDATTRTIRCRVMLADRLRP